MKRNLLLPFVFYGICTITSPAQDLEKTIFSSFDQEVSLHSTLLSYGPIFEEKYRKRNKNNHNFFQEEFFQKGEVRYHNENFYNVDIKYEITDDFLIVKIPSKNKEIAIVPEKKLIQRFSIGPYEFVNSGTKEIGFLEELFVHKEVSFYKKHKKKSIEKKDLNFVYHTFKKRKEKYYLFYNKHFHQANSKSDFIKIFPNNKKEISRFFRENKLLLKRNYPSFVKKLIFQIYQ